MKRVAAFVLVTAVTAWIATATIAARPRAGQSAARDTSARRAAASTISGRVLAADTGAPIRRAVVRLASSELSEARSSMTDADGKYEFADLSPGSYMVVAQKGGFLTMQLGAKEPDETGKPVKIGEAEVVRNADIVLPRGSAINGRVVDEFGDPVAGAMVRLMRYRSSGGSRQLTMSTVASTNDIGQYRAYGLQPGAYYVAAQPTQEIGVEVGERSGYAPTYYPGTPDAASAQAVQVDAGQDVANVDIMLGVVRTARLSGIALDSQGRPASSSTVVAVMPQSSGLGSTGYGRVQPDGTFAIRNLPPGDYVVTLTVPNQATQRTEWAQVRLAVAGSDVSGLMLQASLGATVSGRLLLEGTSSVQASRFVVIAAPAATSRDAIPSPGGSPGQVREDGAFTITGVFGERLFRLGSRGGTAAPGNWTLKAVYLNGRDVTDTPTSFDGREALDGLQVVATDRVTHVTVAVNDERGQPVDGACVVVFPEDPARWNPTAGSRFQRSGTARGPDPYKTDGLPPAEYVAVAVPSMTNLDVWDPEFLERASRSGVRFTLTEGETKALTLKVVEARR